MSNNPKLDALVKALPTLYQPIYGHNEWDDKAQRSCEDRLLDIKKIYDDLSAKVQRPLRVLDLGCCLGYISLKIAKWGGYITGVDSNVTALNLCEFLAGEHPDFKIKFVNEKIEKFIPTIKNDEYDLVLGYSVFHWITKQIGFNATKKLFDDMAEKIPIGLFEIATASEFPELNLPKNYREYFKGYFFKRVLNRYIWNDKRKYSRPLCFTSNKYVHFDDFGILKIDKIPVKARPHCICGDKFIKLVANTKQEIHEMAQNEIRFLQDLGGKNDLPKLHAIVQETDETGNRTFIISDNIKGLRIAEQISKKKEKFDTWNTIEQLLRWIIFFEKHGYYQKDLHIGNFIFNENEKIIPIDYGLMIHEPISHRWPYNLRLQLFGFMNSIFAKRINRETNLIVEGKRKYYSITHLLTKFSQYISEDKYHRILALKDDEKFFENLYEILFPADKEPVGSHCRSLTIGEVEILEKEQYLHDLCTVLMSHEQSINNLNKMLLQQSKKIEQLESIIKKLSAKT